MPKAGDSARGGSDEPLVAAARDGDRRAFELLLDARLAAAVAKARATLGDERAALDATAEAFVRAWRDLAVVRDPGRFEPWFDGILAAVISGRHGEPGESDATDVRQLRYAVLRRIRTTQQRAGWRARLDRWIPSLWLRGWRSVSGPVGLLRRAGPARWGRARPNVRGLLAVGIAAAAVVLVVAVGVPRFGSSAAPPASRGPVVVSASPAATQGATALQFAAVPGVFAFARDGDMYVATRDGAAALVAHVDGMRFRKPLWAPGRPLLAFTSDEPAAFVLDLERYHLRRLGTGQADAWSPDGRRLAVSGAPEGRRFDAWGPFRVFEVDTGATVPLLVPDGTHIFGGTVDWSPNGRWIAAAAMGEQGPRLVRITVETGAILDIGSVDAGFVPHPSWSPNSMHIAVESMACSGPRRCPDSVSVMDADGSNSRPLTEPGEVIGPPKWSPDGSWIAYAVAPPNSEKPYGTLELGRPDGSERRTLVADAGRGFAWSADGRSIVYAAWSSTSISRVWEASVATGFLRAYGIQVDVDEKYGWDPDASLAFGSGFDVPTTFAAAGDALAPSAGIALASPSAGPPADAGSRWSGLGTVGGPSGCDAMSVEFSGTVRTVRTLAGAETSDCSVAGWSPDGEAFLFAVNDHLSLIHRDGSETAIYVGGGPGGSAFWSPRAGYIAVEMCDAPGACDSDDRYTIVRRDGRVASVVPGWPVWSPDERLLAVGVGDRLLMGSGDGSDLKPIGAFPQPVAWSPDDQRFAFVRDGQAWTAKVDGSDVRNASAFEFGWATFVDWSPDGRYLTVGQGATSLWLIARDGSMRRRLDVGTRAGWGTVAWAPDGSRFAITTWNEIPEVIIAGVNDPRPVALGDAALGAWSPDSKYLAVVGGWSGSSQHIDVVNADGSGRVTIVTGQDAGQPQVWLP